MLNRRRFLLHSSLVGMAALPTAGTWSRILGPSLTVDHDLEAVTGDGRPVTLARPSV